MNTLILHGFGHSCIEAEKVFQEWPLSHQLFNQFSIRHKGNLTDQNETIEPNVFKGNY